MKKMKLVMVGNGMAGVRTLEELLALAPERRYLDWISIFSESRRAELYDEDFLAQLATDPAAFLRSAWRRLGR